MNTPTIEAIKKAAHTVTASARKQGYQAEGLHQYTDADGELIYCRLRLKHPETGDKWIRPLSRDASGAWCELKEPPFPDGKPLYLLHKLAASPDATVILVEGEKCADWLAKLNIMATTSGAADSARLADWQPLAGRDVLVWPDNDTAGLKYAEEATDKLTALRCKVKRIDIDALNLPPKGDCVDWLQTLGRKATAADIWALPVIEQVTEKVEAVGCDSSPSIVAVEAIPLPENTALPDTPPFQSDDEIIQWLASLKPLEYEKVRIEQAKAMSCRPAVLDGLVKAARSDESEADRLPFAEVEPHPEPIDPAILLSDVVNLIRQFIVLDTEQAHASALWVALTWFIDVVQVAPLLVITAPEMACGKSQLRDLLSKIVQRSLSTNNMKAATLFRISEKWHPSLMLDEVDLMLKSDDEIINLVNAGHHRGASQVWRLVGDNHDPKSFDVWGAKCFAGIALEKIFPASTLSRAIVIKLRRKLSHEPVDRMRYAAADKFDSIAEKLAKFALDYSQQVRLARPLLPDELSDRDQDNWEPLLAIASCAGDEWLAKATAAALKLSGAAEKTVSTGNELLADIQHVFESKKLDRTSTADLIAALCDDEENAWATYNRGKQITPRQVARQLAGYGIASKTIRVGAYETPKGFELAQFSDAFVRYLSTPLNLPQHPQQTPEANKHAVLTVADNPPQKAIRNNSATPEAVHSLGCGGVADKTPIFGGAEASRPNASHLRI